MSDIILDTSAFAKMILHAVKYPHCAVNGVVLADSSSGAKKQDLNIVDSVPLFHHSHYVSPMAEIALTQIETVAASNNQFIAGYYAGCENFRDNTIEKCPGQKIAEKIAEHYPNALFIVIDNKKVMQNLGSPPINVYQYNDGKWKPKDKNKVLFHSLAIETTSHLLQRGVPKELVDFDNYLDDISQDWTNTGIDKLIASFDASESIDPRD